MYLKPWPSSPTRCASGTRRSSMNSSFELTALRPIFLIGRMSTWSRSRSVRNRVSPSVFFATSSNLVVRVSSRIFSDSIAFEIHTLRPFTT